MFFREERAKEIQLFLKCDCSYTATIRELGYLSISVLRKWHKEYLIFGELYREYPNNYYEKQKRRI